MYKPKSEKINVANEYRYFLESIFVEVKRLFVLVYLPKGIIKNYNFIINGKKFYDQAIDSDIKRYEEIRKLATVKSEDYTTGCFLDYNYIKNHYRLIAIDLSRRKELHAEPKATQQIEFVAQLKKLDDDDNATDAANDQSMFVLKSL